MDSVHLNAFSAFLNKQKIRYAVTNGDKLRVAPYPSVHLPQI